MKKPQVLILYNKIFHYRIPIWNLLANKCDLTIAYSEGGVPDGIHREFKVKYIPYKKIGPIVWHQGNIRKMSQKYDAVIAYGDILWLKYMLLAWFNRTRVAFWTIGVTTSEGYDSRPQKDPFFRFFYKRADAMIFYSEDPIEKYVRHGFRKEGLFVANNTVEVLDIPIPTTKDYITFIGTLHKRKGLYLLLNAYLELRDVCPLPKLIIIGNGPEYDNIANWIIQNEMAGMIEMKGHIIDAQDKAEILSHALACISPKQAGLSVLECMGYGVPFVTTKDAITGGERFNIHDGVDGVIMDDVSQLKDVVLDIALHKDKYIEMGHRARCYYYENRLPQQMADSLWDAICFLIKK